MLPNEKKTFVFTFRSEKEGVFFEEWELHTIPELLSHLPHIQLNGIALKYDVDEPKYEYLNNFRRKAIQDRIEANAKLTLANEVIDDLISGVRTPTPPPPNIRDPLVFCYMFEENNKNLRYNDHYLSLISLNFSNFVMSRYFSLLKELSEELKQNITDPEVDCSISFLQKLIEKVTDKKRQNHYKNELKYLIQAAQSKAYDRSYAFPYIKGLVDSLFTSIPEMSDKLCAEAAIPEFTFEDPVDRTPEEQAKREEAKKAALADYYKKSKKKPKSEEEEKQAWEGVKAKINEELTPQWNKKLEGLERALEKKEIMHKMNNHERMDYSKYETLSRKKSIYDETLQDNIILLRLDLDVELTPVQYDEIEVPIEITKGI